MSRVSKIGLEINNFTCHRCTKCCTSFRIDITFEDVVRWIRQDRNEILEELRFISWSNQPNREILAFKSTAEDGHTCKFLGIDGLCTIHNTKPLACKNFPFNLSRSRNLTCPGVNTGKKTRKNRNKR